MKVHSRFCSFSETTPLQQVTFAFIFVALMWALTASMMSISVQWHFDAGFNQSFLAALILSVDFPHQVFTLRRVNELLSNKQIEFTAFIPVLGLWLLFAFVASLSSEEVLLCTLSYFTFHHNLKQQQAWLIKGRQALGLLPRISEFLHFSCIILAILFWHFSSLGSSFIFANDLINTTQIEKFIANLGIRIDKVLQTLCIATALGAFIIEFILLSKHKDHLRIFALGGTASSWVFGVAVLQSKVLFAIFNILSHSLPYMIMASFPINSSECESRGFPIVRLLSLGLFYLMALLAAQLYATHSYSGLSQLSLTHHESLQDTAQNFLICLFFLLPLIHYFSDAVIWRKLRS